MKYILKIQYVQINSNVFKFAAYKMIWKVIN
jgi:hypothetical protein